MMEADIEHRVAIDQRSCWQCNGTKVILAPDVWEDELSRETDCPSCVGPRKIPSIKERLAAIQASLDAIQAFLRRN